MDYQKQPKDLQPTKDFFVGIDSDGCVFDSMEPKQKEFFCPNVLRYFGLLPVSKVARETWEFVNLYSRTRGINRFLALLEFARLLEERPEVAARGMEVPDLTPLKEWTGKETKLGNPALKAYAAGTDDPVIHRVLEWSEKVNEEIGLWVKGLKPFTGVREALEIMKDKANAMVVSQTPVEALEREWQENGIDGHVRVIAGQEYGTKTEHLALAAKGKYADDHILMVGDAPGDMKAARTNGVLFYPINPGDEEASWERFHKEALQRFFDGTYAGAYEEALVEEFNKSLPETPPWK